MGYKEMAYDAGYRGDEADSVAAALEDQDRRDQQRYEQEREIEDVELNNLLNDAPGG